jgi:membrane protease YdiL (CAAX protease family)
MNELHLLKNARLARPGQPALHKSGLRMQLKPALRALLRLDALHTDWKAVSVVMVATLLLAGSVYRNTTRIPAVESLVLYLLAPLFYIVVVLRESPAQYGFRLGEWKTGLLFLAAGLSLITLLAFLLTRGGQVQAYYSQRSLKPAEMGLLALQTIGWEFIFRGFLLYALLRLAGTAGIVLQAVPFTLMHFGAPEIETLSCIFGGTLFGYVAWRTRSFIYPFILHTFLSILIHNLS